MERDYRAAARVFKALCDPKRLAILEELRGGEKCACVLQEPMDPLPAEQDGQGLRGEAAAGADYAGYRTGDTA